MCDGKCSKGCGKGQLEQDMARLSRGCCRARPGWVSVKERLPGGSEDVIVAFTERASDGTVRRATAAAWLGVGSKWNGFDAGFVGLPPNCEITDWMPLPEPPEVEA